jgi:hypothetical protein
MEYKKFKEIITSLQESDKRINQANKLKIDLIDFVDEYHSIITKLFEEVYGKEGYDWISWFCYENNYGQGELKGWDNKKPICYDIKSLWEYVESKIKK